MVLRKKISKINQFNELGEQTIVNNEFNLDFDDLGQRLEALNTSLESLKHDISDYIDQNDGQNTTHYHFDRQLLGILGEVAGVKQDVAASQTYIEQLHDLIQIITRITASLDLKFVIDEVLDTALQLTGGERAIIFLTHAEGHKVEIQAARNWQGMKLGKEDLSISNSVVQDVIATHQPVITTDAQSDLGIRKTDSMVMNELRSIIALPLMVRMHLIGLLYLDSRISHGLFNEENFPIMAAFANQVAIAIENAHQYAQVHNFLQKTHHELMNISIEINEESVAKKVEEITTSPLFAKLQSFKQNSSSDE